MWRCCVCPALQSSHATTWRQFHEAPDDLLHASGRKLAAESPRACSLSPPSIQQGSSAPPTFEQRPWRQLLTCFAKPAMAPRGTADIEMVADPSSDTLAPGTTGMNSATSRNGSSMGYPRRDQTATSVPITSISPIPKVTEQTPRKSHHRRGKTCTITLSPCTEELEQRQKARTSKDEPQPSGSWVSGIAQQKSAKRDRAKACSSKQDDTPSMYCCDLFVNSRCGKKWIKCGQWRVGAWGLHRLRRGHIHMWYVCGRSTSINACVVVVCSRTAEMARNWSSVANAMSGHFRTALISKRTHSHVILIFCGRLTLICACVVVICSHADFN